MRWKGERESENVEDRRSISGGQMAIGGGLGTLVIVIIVMLLGGDPQALLNQIQQNAPQQGGGQQLPPNPQQDELVKFVKVVLGSTEDVWSQQLPAQARVNYRQPKLVLFNGQVASACGRATAAVGPFYCPGDNNVYIDLSFYDELKNRFGAKGDFAQAYVIAHEVGHHVQNLLGISDEMHNARGRVPEKEYNELSVRLELQADYLAGVWAHHAQQTRNILDAGDIDEALVCAQAIGDDRLQKQGQGYVVPDSFTHGTSAQRARWFKKGFESGDIKQGDTFKIPYRDL